MATRYDCTTTIGLQRIASAMANQEVFTHLAFGDGDDPAIPSDLVLENETYRAELDSIAADGFACRGEVVIQASDIGAGIQDIGEVGSVDNAVGGNMICRHALANTFQFSGNQKLSVVHCIVAT